MNQQRTIRAFASRLFTTRARTTLVASMDDRSLLWAYFWPGHLREAKSIIAAQLINRGHSEEEISNFLPDSTQLAVSSSFKSEKPKQEYLAITSRRSTFFKYYRATMPLIIILLFILIEKIDEDENLKPLGVLFILFFFIEIFVCGFLFKNIKLRVLLLRPFGEKKMTGALKRFVLKNIGKMGHVYTLSDQNYRPNLFLAALNLVWDFGVVLMSPFFMNSIRVGSVHNARSFRKLERFMSKLERFMKRQLKLSLLTFQNGGQALNVRSSDAWWKICVLMLINSCEVVVIDLSLVKEGTAWELRTLRELSLLSKCVFIVGEDQLEIATRRLLQEGFGYDVKLPIYTYRADGRLPATSQFQSAFEKIVFDPSQRSRDLDERMAI